VSAFTCNSERMLPDLLRSLPAGLSGVDDWRLVVADSGSTDATVPIAREMGRDVAPAATVVELPNLGFAAQANAAAAADPEADAVLILSQTARLRPGCAARLLDAVAKPGIGVAVPRLFDGHGRLRTSLRRTPTLGRAWGEALLGGRLTRRFPALTEVVRDPAGYGDRTGFTWATGGVTMFRLDCMRAIGGWDEAFFLYSEETDFELRAADHGYGVVFVPDALATHIGGESKVRPEFWAHLCANRVRLYGKRHGRVAATAFWAAITAGEALRLPSRRATRQRAIGKLVRERSALVRGEPARKPAGY